MVSLRSLREEEGLGGKGREGVGRGGGVMCRSERHARVFPNLLKVALKTMLVWLKTSTQDMTPFPTLSFS